MGESVGWQEPVSAPAPPKKQGKWIWVLVPFLAIALLIAVAISFNPSSPTPSQSGPTWQPVETFSGTELQETLETDIFNVTGSMFRMKWTVTEADCEFVPKG